MWIILALTLFFSLVQTSFFTLNFVFLLAVAVNQLKPDKAALPVFLMGIIFDLVAGLPLGLSSLVFLLTSLIFSAAKNTWFFWPALVLTVFLSAVFLSYFQILDWQVMPGILTMAAGLVLVLVLKWMGIGFEKKQDRLEI